MVYVYERRMHHWASLETRPYLPCKAFVSARWSCLPDMGHEVACTLASFYLVVITYICIDLARMAAKAATVLSKKQL